ncbi:MAG: hypothetical protein V1816_23145 [Pseudomonadota bacterium]
MKKARWCFFFTVLAVTLILSWGTVSLAEHTVFVGGKDKIYVDTNGDGVITEGVDGYYSAYRACVSFPDCGTATARYAIFVQGANGLDCAAGTARRYIFQIGGEQVDGSYILDQKASASYMGDDGITHNMTDPVAAADGETQIKLSKADWASTYTRGDWFRASGKTGYGKIILNDGGFFDSIFVQKSDGSTIEGGMAAGGLSYVGPADAPTHIKIAGLNIPLADGTTAAVDVYLPLAPDGSLNITDNTGSAAFPTIEVTTKPEQGPVPFIPTGGGGGGSSGSGGCFLQSLLEQ